MAFRIQLPTPSSVIVCVCVRACVRVSVLPRRSQGLRSGSHRGRPPVRRDLFLPSLSGSFERVMASWRLFRARRKRNGLRVLGGQASLELQEDPAGPGSPEQVQPEGVHAVGEAEVSGSIDEGEATADSPPTEEIAVGGGVVRVPHPRVVAVLLVAAVAPPADGVGEAPVSAPGKARGDVHGVIDPPHEISHRRIHGVLAEETDPV
mmetsp:Transcript_26075/g.61246  ORF Transcript_26075/g.61246 Transcript_26075/m.61246 type:complete len:206 (-) Transcript_26075:78-695(-)